MFSFAHFYVSLIKPNKQTCDPAGFTNASAKSQDVQKLRALYSLFAVKLIFAAVSDQIMLKAIMQNASIIPDFLYIGAFEMIGFNQLQHKLT